MREEATSGQRARDKGEREREGEKEKWYFIMLRCDLHELTVRFQAGIQRRHVTAAVLRVEI